MSASSQRRSRSATRKRDEPESSSDSDDNAVASGKGSPRVNGGGAAQRKPLDQVIEDVRIRFDNKSATELVKSLATFTSPDLSIFFVLFFIVLAYFHESHYAVTGVAIAAWLVLQLVSSVINEDFRTDLFWSIFSLFGNLLFYLFLGYCWSMAKLYLDVWQGHLDPTLMSKIRMCVSDAGKPGCVVSFMFEIKWKIVHWLTTWPISMAYTISRDPLRIMTDLIFEWSRQRYLAIITAALRAHDSSASYLAAHPPLETSGRQFPDGSIGIGAPLHTSASDEWLLLAYTAAYIVGYILVGFIWSHVKLFIDVWQGTLPPSLDQEVRSVYAGNKNYWSFVAKIKWLVLTWLVTWPLSIAYTILRHPFRILFEFIYKLQQRKLVWIVNKAMETRANKQE